jgi:hypothetical protein
MPESCGYLRATENPAGRVLEQRWMQRRATTGKSASQSWLAAIHPEHRVPVAAAGALSQAVKALRTQLAYC